MMILKHAIAMATLVGVLGAVSPVYASPSDSQPLLMVYKGAGCTGRDHLPEFERYLGRRVDGVIDFSASASWKDIHNETNWALDCWSDPAQKLVWSVPMLPNDGATLQQGATGAYDAEFAELAKQLISHHRGDAYLRIGWEFNGGWYKWAAAGQPTAFKAYFRHIVAALRSVPGARFKIVWNPTLGMQQIAPDQVYPGDDVVDVVAADVYNQSWNARDADPNQRWTDLRTEQNGLDWLKTFAAQHGKPIAIPEWGTGTRPDGHGFGDDPAFIHHMAGWMRDNHVIFQGYWDYHAPDFNAQLSDGQYPLSAQAFRAEFQGR